MVFLVVVVVVLAIVVVVVVDEVFDWKDASEEEVGTDELGSVSTHPVRLLQRSNEHNKTTIIFVITFINTPLSDFM